MKLLLLGCKGQVGWELQRALAPLGKVTALARDSAGPWQADLSQPATMAGLVRALAPDLIVNAAAYTAVDKAESEPALAQAINAESVGELAHEAARRGAWLLHYSSDYVFDGSGSQARDEAAEAAPLSVYGRSKRDGEALIRASGCRHLILRTSWVYGARGGNFIRTMLRLAQERDALRVVCDQIGAPTGADLIADCSAHMLRAALAKPELGGTYHLAAAGETSWHGYAALVIEAARARGLPIRVAAEAVAPVSSAEYPTAARRPLNSRLSTAKLQDRFGLVPPPWQQGVLRALEEIIGPTRNGA